MLRHARLVEFGRVAVNLQIRHGMAQAVERFEPELLGIVDGTLNRPTTWQRFERPIPILTGQIPLGDFLRRNWQTVDTAALLEQDAAL